MGITANFKITDIEKALKQGFLENVNRKALRAFSKSCLETINYAKSNRGERYTDQTGALNSSTGFQLYKDGELVESFFESATTGDGTGNADGISAGKNVASKVDRPDKPIVAVLVAGMDYALYVEAKGKDVLTGAKNRFSEILTKNLQIEFSENSGVGFEINAD